MVPTIEETVQNAQDELQSLQNELDDHSALQESTEDNLEAAEDAIDDIDDANTEDDRADAVARANDHIQAAQDDLNELQDAIGYDDADLAKRVETVEEALEVVEDQLTEIEAEDDGDSDEPEEPDELIIEVNEEEKEPPERFMTPLEIVRFFDYDPDNVVLYKARDIEDDGSREGDQFLPRDEEIDLYELNRFACLPSETPYGAAANTSIDDLDNEPLVTDIERLREEYEVDIKHDPNGNFIQVIVRDWPIPSDAYTKDKTDVMIRAPQGYPQQPPDWVYVEPDLQLESGGWPRKHNKDRVAGWLGLSWHINNVDMVSWVPYETDLKWYLDTFCDLRLRQGE